MKTKLKPARIVALLLVIMVIQFISSCEDDSPEPSCIEPPCGTIDNSSYNLTIQTANPSNEVTSALIIIDNVEIILSLDGLNPDESIFYTCWQTIPEITANSTVKFSYELNGEPIFGVLNTTLISENQVVIQIDGDSVILLDYEVCVDFM